MAVDLKKILLKDESENRQAVIGEKVAAIQQAIEEGQTFFYLSNNERKENEWDVSFVTTSLENGMQDLMVFIDAEDIQTVREYGSREIDIVLLLTLLLCNDEFDGIAVNCGNDGMFIITKALAQRIIEPFYQDSPDGELSEEKLNEAIHFATEMHWNDFRKGTDLPYIIHPMEVMNILQSMNADINLMIAGLLHDVVEDTVATIQMISDRFGEDVAALVAAHTENKSLSWKDRKQAAIDDITIGSKRMQMLVLADTLSNQSAMLRDYQQIGDELWERFNRGKDDQVWYYGKKQDAFWPLQFDPDTKKAYWQLVNDYKDLFVSYFLDVTGHKIYQKSPDEIFVFDRDVPKWEVLSEDAAIKGIEITRAFAETIEDAWYLKVEEKRQWKEWLFSDAADPTSEEIAGMIIEKLREMKLVKGEA